MIGVAMYITIKSLWEIHKNKSMIARLTGHDFKDSSQEDKRNISALLHLDIFSLFPIS